MIQLKRQKVAAKKGNGSSDRAKDKCEPRKETPQNGNPIGSQPKALSYPSNSIVRTLSDGKGGHLSPCSDNCGGASDLTHLPDRPCTR